MFPTHLAEDDINLISRNVALGFAAISVSWAARTCSNLLVNVVPQGEEQRHLVAYACFLVYATFSLLVLF